jgi:hypothetical protein
MNNLLYYEDKDIKENEIRALALLDAERFPQAEKFLLKNLAKKTSSLLTYNLLIKIYSRDIMENSSFSSLIRTLNSAIKNTGNAGFYRKLKKQALMFRLNSLIAS